MPVREGSPAVWLLAVIVASVVLSTVPNQYLIPALLAEAAGIVLAIGASFIRSIVRTINRRDDPRQAKRPRD